MKEQEVYNKCHKKKKNKKKNKAVKGKYKVTLIS